MGRPNAVDLPAEDPLLPLHLEAATLAGLLEAVDTLLHDGSEASANAACYVVAAALRSAEALREDLDRARSKAPDAAL